MTHSVEIPNIVALVVGLCLICPPSQAVQCDPPEVQFGQVYVDQQLRQSVLIINHSPKAVTIRSMRSNAPKRVRLEVDDKTIEPLGVSVLTVELLTDTSAGPVQAVVTLNTDEDEPPVRLPVGADVVNPYALTGEPLFFDYRQPTVSMTRTTHVQSAVGGTVRLDPGAVNDPFFDIRSSAAPSEPGRQALIIRPREPLPCGLTVRDILVPSLEEDGPPCRLQVAGFNPPEVHVYPDTLLVAAADREQLRMIFVEHYLDDPVQIVEVKSPGPWLRYEWAPESTPLKQRLNVYVRGLAGEAGDLGNLIFVTDDDKLRELAVPIRIGNVPVASQRIVRTLDFVAPASKCGCLR